MQVPIETWNHHEPQVFRQLGAKLAGTIPDYESLKSLRTYINKVARASPLVTPSTE